MDNIWDTFARLLAAYNSSIVTLHFLAVAIGLGGATITDILFFKFLRNFRISKKETDIMRTLSRAIWFSLAILVLTGVALYIPQANELNHSAKFLAKMVVVAVIIINGIFLNLFVAPKLVKISFEETRKHQPEKLHRERKIAFALGVVSIISWYSAFLLGMLRNISMSFSSLILIYVLLLLLGIFVSQYIERFFVRRANSK